MTREDLLRDPVYWTSTLQIDLYNHILQFMKSHDMNKKQLAEFLGCSKSYVTQLLSGDYDHKLSKFVELSLAIGKVPVVTFKDLDDYIEIENKYSSFTVSNIATFAKVNVQKDFTLDKISA